MCGIGEWFFFMSFMGVGNNVFVCCMVRSNNGEVATFGWYFNEYNVSRAGLRGCMLFPLVLMY